jgi:hypothetical protein
MFRWQQTFIDSLRPSHWADERRILYNETSNSAARPKIVESAE